MRSRPRDEAMAEAFREDPDYAIALLNDILADGDQAALLVTLRQMSKAFGGMTKVAPRAPASRAPLCETLSARGHSQLRNLSAILATMDLRLTVQPMKTRAAPRRAPRKAQNEQLIAAA